MISTRHEGRRKGFLILTSTEQQESAAETLGNLLVSKKLQRIPTQRLESLAPWRVSTCKTCLLEAPMWAALLGTSGQQGTIRRAHTWHAGFKAKGRKRKKPGGRGATPNQAVESSNQTVSRQQNLSLCYHYTEEPQNQLKRKQKVSWPGEASIKLPLHPSEQNAWAEAFEGVIQYRVEWLLVGLRFICITPHKLLPQTLICEFSSTTVSFLALLLRRKAEMPNGQRCHPRHCPLLLPYRYECWRKGSLKGIYK